MDIKKGYSQLRLYPEMRYWLLLRQEEKYDQVAGLLFVRCRFQIWCCTLMAPFVWELCEITHFGLRERLLYRSRKLGVVSTEKDCRRVSIWIYKFLGWLDLSHQDNKGFQGNASRIEPHMRSCGQNPDEVFGTPSKGSEHPATLEELTVDCSQGRRLVQEKQIRSFSGKCVL